MAKKGVSKKTGLVKPLVPEDSKKSSQLLESYKTVKETPTTAPAVEPTSSEYKPTPEDYTYTPPKPEPAPKLTREDKQIIRTRRKKSAATRGERIAAETNDSKPKSTSVGPLSGQPVRTPDPKAPGQRLTAVTGETIRPATDPELRRGIPSRVVRDQAKPTIPASDRRVPNLGETYQHSDGRKMVVGPHNIEEVISDIENPSTPKSTAPATGPRLPKLGQKYKHSDGRLMTVTADNIAEIHADAKRTVLPTAGPEVMVQPGRPTPLPGPRGGVRPNVPKNNRGNRAGLGAAHSVVREHADRALGHLDAMAAAQHGTGPYKQAQRSFQVVHKAIGEKNMSPSIHNMLQLAHNHIDSKLPGTDKMLNATKEAVGDTLRAGKKAEEERTFRQIQTDRGGN